jgi:hypothetical protein
VKEAYVAYKAMRERDNGESIGEIIGTAAETIAGEN